MRRTTARSSELRVNGAAVLLLLISAALCAWALLYTSDGSGTRVHGARAATAASTTEAPVQIDIPRAGVHARTVPVGATSAAPPPQCAGWYAAGAAPGDPGRSVIIGDRTVFSGLPRLRPHDVIEISDGTQVCYSVTGVEHDAAQRSRRPVAGLGPKAAGTAAQLELIARVTANETVVVHADRSA